MRAAQEERILETILRRLETMSKATDTLIDTVAGLLVSVGNVQTLVNDLKSAPAADDAAVLAANDKIVQAKATLDGLVPAPPPPAALAVSPAEIAAVVGQPVSGTLTASGGSAPYTFESSSAEISIDASGNYSGTISAAGVVTLTVTDAASSTAQSAITAA